MRIVRIVTCALAIPLCIAAFIAACVLVPSVPTIIAVGGLVVVGTIAVSILAVLSLSFARGITDDGKRWPWWKE